jgi:hypothetical protein
LIAQSKAETPYMIPNLPFWHGFVARESLLPAEHTFEAVDLYVFLILNALIMFSSPLNAALRAILFENNPQKPKCNSFSTNAFLICLPRSVRIGCFVDWDYSNSNDLLRPPFVYNR